MYVGGSTPSFLNCLITIPHAEQYALTTAETSYEIMEEALHYETLYHLV